MRELICLMVWRVVVVTTLHCHDDNWAESSNIFYHFSRHRSGDSWRMLRSNGLTMVTSSVGYQVIVQVHLSALTYVTRSVALTEIHPWLILNGFHVNRPRCSGHEMFRSLRKHLISKPSIFFSRSGVKVRRALQSVENVTITSSESRLVKVTLQRLSKSCYVIYFSSSFF